MFDLIDSLPNQKPEWVRWVEQAHQDSIGAGSIGWVIINKRNQREPVITMPIILYRLIRRVRNVNPYPRPFLRMVAEQFKTPLVSVRLVDWLLFASPTKIIEAIQQYKNK
jgi:hypothetical protein